MLTKFISTMDLLDYYYLSGFEAEDNEHRNPIL